MGVAGTQDESGGQIEVVVLRLSGEQVLELTVQGDAGPRAILVPVAEVLKTQPSAIQLLSGKQIVPDCIQLCDLCASPADSDVACRLTLTAVVTQAYAVVTASADGTARIWSTDTGDCLRVFGEAETPDPEDMYAWSEPEYYAPHVDVSPDGRLLATVSAPSARVWAVRSGACLHALDHHTAWVASCQFLPCSKKLLTASEHSVSLWLAEEGRCLWRTKAAGFYIPRPLLVDGGVVLPYLFGGHLQLLSLADGSCSWSAEAPQEELWEVPDEDPAAQCTLARFERTLLSPCGSFVLLTAFSGAAALWDLSSVTCRVWHVRVGGNQAAFSPDSRHVAFSKDGSVEIWSVAEGCCLRIWSVAEGRPAEADLDVGNYCFDPVFSPGGDLVFVASDAGCITAWDVATGRRVGATLRDDQVASAARFSPNGRLFLTWSRYGQVARLWHTSRLLTMAGDLEPDAVLDGHLAPVATARFMPWPFEK